MNRQDLRKTVKRLAQTGQDESGVSILAEDPDDFDVCIDQAIALFGKDRPNLRVVDLTIATTEKFRLVLSGAGALLTGADAWVDGVSYLTEVWSPYTATAQGDEANDPNQWRVRQGPGGTTVLELLDHTAAIGSVVRLGMVQPYLIHATDDAQSTIPAGYARPFELLAAFFVLTLAAIRAVQNTGNSGMPNDIVDRRSQSDIYRSRAKELRAIYSDLMGTGGDGSDGSGLDAASGFKDLDWQSGFVGGFLFHRASSR